MVSTALTGANVADLRALAQSFDRSADQLARAGQQIGSTIADPRSWGGRDAERFRATFASSTRPTLNRVADDLHTAANRLRSEADQQETASAATGGALNGLIGGLHIADTVWNVADKIHSATDAIHSGIENADKELKFLTEHKFVSADTAETIAKSVEKIAPYADKVTPFLKHINPVVSLIAVGVDSGKLGYDVAGGKWGDAFHDGLEVTSDVLTTIPTPWTVGAGIGLQAALVIYDNQDALKTIGKQVARQVATAPVLPAA